MKTMKPIRRSERGVALLIAIFALLLISGIAMSMLLMSSTETSIAANYKSTSQAFYAAYAGLEEGRTRLWQNFPGSIAATWYAPQPIGGPVPVGTVMYITNPAVGEVVNPINMAATNPYADTEYFNEWGTQPGAAPFLKATQASMPWVGGLSGPTYKWVRLTTKTERSTGIDVNGDGNLNNLTAIYTDGNNQFVGDPSPGSNIYQQVFRITALAVAPGGGRRVVQYDAYRVVFNLAVPSALTFDGQGSALFPANSAVYHVDGNDNPPAPANQPPGGCPAPGAPVPGVGVITPGDDVAISNAIPKNRQANYTGAGGVTPDVQNVAGALPNNLKTVGDLDKLVQSLNQGATTSLSPLAGQTTITNAQFTDASPASGLQIGSPSSPEIIVANGPTVLSGAVTGYGILVVTDDFVIKGNFTWEGIILVIGSGYVQVAGGGGGSIDGAMLLARTRDAAGNPLPSASIPGGSTLDWQGGGGNGIHYSSCNINNANNANAIYRVVSFREARE